MTTLLTRAENEASTIEEEEEVIVNSCTASQLDDLLAAYDMHELANKMAAVESEPTTASDLLLSSSSGAGETGVHHFSPSHHVKEGENGDDRELVNDADCLDATTTNLFTDENRIEMNEPSAAVATLTQTVPVLKVKRDRRKRPPNKSILRPVFSPDSSPRFHSQTQAVTTDNMIESIPDLFRSLSSSSQTSADLDHVGRPKVTRDVLSRNPANGSVNVLNNSGVLEQIKQAVLPTFGSSFGPPTRLKLEASSVAGYICPDCSDHFWLESSFAQHVQRRSVYINFFCHFCSKLLIFYNRCSLLGHARIHRERHQPCDVSNATLAPLEKDLIPCIQDSKIVVPSALTLVTKHDNRAAQKRRRKDTSSPIVTIMIPEKETNSVFTTTRNPGNFQQTETVQSHSCCECHQSCKTQQELCEHFGENREVPPTTDSECPQCHMICTSRCSLTSHQRMHAKDRPYVCPECGLRVSELWQDFKNHVTDVCLHHSRTLGFRCPACGVLSVNPEQLKTHVSTDHGVVLYKCQSCPRAFKSGRSFDSHRRSSHADDQSTATYSSIQKCPLCDAVFHRQSLLTKHLDTHFQEIFAAAKYVFRCLECGRLSENKADLREHLRAVHSFPQASEKKHGKPQKKKQKQSPQVDHEAEPNVAASRTSESTAICDHCQREFRTMLGLNVHRFRSHGIRINQSNETTMAAAESNDKQAADGDRPPPITIKIKKKKKSTTLSNGSSYILDNTPHGNSGMNGETTDDCSSTKPTCKLCYDEFPDVRALAEHGYLHIQEGFLVCMLCSNLTFTNKIALSRHLEKHAILTNYPSTCVYCQEVLKSRTQTAVHWREEHGLSSFQCPHCETRYLYHKSLSRHIREVHRGLRKVKKKSDMTDLDTSSAVDGSMCPEQDEEMVGDISETVTDLSQSKEPDATSPTVESSAESVVPETVAEDAAAAVPENVPVREDWLEKSGEYRCAKCDFCSLTRSSFQLHIVQHRNDTSYQCAECGTCFVVAPSLHKHLKLVHKVKDLEAYQEFIADNGGINSDQTHGEAHLSGLEGANGDFGMESANGLQCSICHLCFDNEQLLKTHSRSHGMAFLQAAASKRSLSGYSSDTSSPSSTPTKCTTK